ncbi:hypothetical protein L7F22_046620 [Adiantum nelumboides]|nr:hypothetical protein [Adiantum nelumboides]
MPSGSRKRKSLKKPKPGEPPSSQGEPPELEAGFEDSMAKDGEEMMEGSSSPRLIDGSSEAMAEKEREEGEELSGETSREENEGAEVEKALAAPDHPEIGTRSPPSQIELLPEVPVIFESEANGEDVEGETPDVSLGDPPPLIEDEKHAPLGETSPGSEALPLEIKPDVEPDAELTALDRDKDGTDIPPEADEGESTERTQDEIRGETQVGSEPGIYESSVELEGMAAMAREDIGTEDDFTAVGVDPSVDETPEYNQQESDEATTADTDAAFSIIEPEGTDVTPFGSTVETNDGPTRVYSEVDESAVETQTEEDAAAEIVDMDPGLGAALAETDKDPAEGEVEAGAPSANIEPEVRDDASPETEAVMDNGPIDAQSEMDEKADQRQLETEAVPSGLEAGNDLVRDVTQVEEDAPIGEIDQEVEPVSPTIEPQTDASESEIEASTQVDSVAREPEPELTLREPEEASGGEFKAELDAALDDSEKDELADADPKSEVSAKPIEAEQDETVPVVAQPETEDRAYIEAEPEVEVKNMLTYLENADPLKEIESESERRPDASDELEAVTGPTSQQVEEKADANEGVETPAEVDTEPADEASTDAFDRLTLEELNQGVETSPEADVEPNGGTTFVYEREAEAEVPEPELEPEVQLSFESKPEQEGSIETESGQQTLIEVAPNELYTQDQDQQQERQTNPGVEGTEPPTIEANHEDSPGVSGSSEAHFVEFTAPSAPEIEAPDIADTSVIASEPQTLESEAASPPEEVVNDAGDTEAVLDNEEGTIYEQPNEPRESIIQQESEGAEDVLDQQTALSGEFQLHAVSSEQNLDAEQHPTITPAEVTLGEEPQVAEAQSSLDKQDSAMDLRKDGATYEQEQTPPRETEKDLGEEETALSTVAEAGSVGNDFDESASDQPLPADFSTSEQDGEVSESREFDDTSSRTPKLIEADSTEEVDSGVREWDESPSPKASDQVGGEHADSGGEDIKVSLATVRNSPEEEVEWKAVQDSEPPLDHEDENFKAENIDLLVDVRPHEDSILSDKEVDIVEANYGDEGTAPPTLGIVPALETLAVEEAALMPKILPSDADGLRRLPSSEPSTQEFSTLGKEGGNQNIPVVNTENSEIDSSEPKDSKALASTKVPLNTSNGRPLLSTSPGQDIEDVQAFRQRRSQETSLPVVVPAKDVRERNLEQGNFNGNEHPSKGGTLQRRTNLLGCCGMLDLLLGKDK